MASHKTIIVLALAVSTLLFACTPPVMNAAPAVSAPTPDAMDNNGYRIGAGDELEVKFYFAPDLNEMVQVRPDGKISLMFLQDVPAAGKTAQELAADIMHQLSPHLRQSDLVVVMRSFASQKAYVGGEVGRPGSVALSGSERLLQVLTSAGWITPAARSKEVLILRCCNSDGQETLYAANIDKIMSGEDVAQNISIHSGDQVLVPPSDAATFDRWIDQHIRQALPFSTSAGVVLTNQWTNNP